MSINILQIISSVSIQSLRLKLKNKLGDVMSFCPLIYIFPFLM